MKKVLVLLTLSGICVASTAVYAGDGSTAPPVVSAARIYHPYQVRNAAPVNLTMSNTDIRSQFLFPNGAQPDPFKNMTFRSAVAGAGILGAIMGGKIALKFWVKPHMCFEPGIDIGSKRADFRLTF